MCPEHLTFPHEQALHPPCSLDRVRASRSRCTECDFATSSFPLDFSACGLRFAGIGACSLCPFFLTDKVTLRADGPRGKRRLCSTAWGLGPSRGAVPTLQVGLGLRGGSPWSCGTSPPEFLWQLLEAGLAALFCVSPSPLCFSEQIARGLVDIMFLCGNSSHTSGFSSVFVPSLEPCPCPWSCTTSSHPYCLNLSSEKK